MGKKTFAASRRWPCSRVPRSRAQLVRWLAAVYPSWVPCNQVSRVADLLTGYYGLLGSDPLPSAELVARYGASRQRVYAVRVEVIRKLVPYLDTLGWDPD